MRYTLSRRIKAWDNVSRKPQTKTPSPNVPRDGQSGQAMAEYAILAAALLGGLMTMGFQVLPNFINALQSYLNGFYILLHLPIP